MNWPSIAASLFVVAVIVGTLLVVGFRVSDPQLRAGLMALLAFGAMCGLAASWLLFGLPLEGA